MRTQQTASCLIKMASDMKTITFCNGKGGTGKSTVTVLTALALHHVGKRVKIVDTDPQQTATKWLSGTDYADLIAHRMTTNADTEIVLVDTPPRLDSAAFQKSVKMADVLIVVSSPSPTDLLVTRDTLDMIESLGEDRKPLRLLFTNVQAGTALGNNLDASTENLGVERLVKFIARRQAYQHSLLLGWEKLPNVARQEILAAALEIMTI